MGEIIKKGNRQRKTGRKFMGKGTMYSIQGNVRQHVWRERKVERQKEAIGRRKSTLGKMW